LGYSYGNYAGGIGNQFKKTQKSEKEKLFAMSSSPQLYSKFNSYALLLGEITSVYIVNLVVCIYCKFGCLYIL
jgi:hypothetical protein